MTTLIAAKDSSSIEDAENIRKACKGFGTDEAVLISILAHRNVAQKKLVRMAYEELYQEDLIQQFKSELSGSFEVKTLQFIAIVFAYLQNEITSSLSFYAHTWMGMNIFVEINFALANWLANG
ncbi:Annexin D8 [Glycine soja]|uniref:Annexin D8 n=1 Tax=Glycine soja TaxID=3848 RepID=A0A445IW42_GLYSO|nr:hypothetical protein JHK87_023813 [Glycine soja]RZB90373.1 Annexin D8 [Glycine soja]